VYVFLETPAGNTVSYGKNQKTWQTDKGTHEHIQIETKDHQVNIVSSTLSYYGYLCGWARLEEVSNE
jgi:hypothetical protein